MEQFDLSKLDAAVKELQEEWKTARKLCCTYWPFPEILEPEDEQKHEEEEISAEEGECVFKGLRMFPAEDCELKKHQQQEQQQQQQQMMLEPEFGEWDIDLIAPQKNVYRDVKIAPKPSPSKLTEQPKSSLKQRAPIDFGESQEEESYLNVPVHTPKEPPAVPNNSPRSLKSLPQDSGRRKKKSSLRT